MKTTIEAFMSDGVGFYKKNFNIETKDITEIKQINAEFTYNHRINFVDGKVLIITEKMAQTLQKYLLGIEDVSNAISVLEL